MSTACSCAEAGATQLDHLDYLVNVEGMDQVEASRLLWVDGLAERTEARLEATAIVRAGLANVIAWLRRAGVAA